MSMSPLKLRLGFKLGIYSKANVIDWVVAQIEEADEPSGDLLDLSMATTKGSHDIYSALINLDKSPEIDEVLISVLSDIPSNELQSIDYCKNLAEKLYAYYVDRDYTVLASLSQIGFFDDGYSLAKQGIGEALEEWHLEFIEFINNLKQC